MRRYKTLKVSGKSVSTHLKLNCKINNLSQGQSP